MICKKCGNEMQLWLQRPGFKSFACPSCEFVAITREDSAQPNELTVRDDVCDDRERRYRGAAE
jgi:hypothetical protein